MGVELFDCPEKRSFHIPYPHVGALLKSRVASTGPIQILMLVAGKGSSCLTVLDDMTKFVLTMATWPRAWSLRSFTRGRGRCCLTGTVHICRPCKVEH